MFLVHRIDGGEVFCMARNRAQACDRQCNLTESFMASPMIRDSTQQQHDGRCVHPPAGPERMALCPLKRETGVRPPSDCMNDSCTSRRPSSKPDSNVWMYLHSQAASFLQ